MEGQLFRKNSYLTPMVSNWAPWDVEKMSVILLQGGGATQDFKCRDDWMEPKVKTQKNPKGFPQNQKKSLTW